MVPMYCFEGLSRESRYKTEREVVIQDEQVERRRVDSGWEGIGHSPVSLLCDTFCAVVWVNSCVVQHLLVVLGLGASVSGALKNLWQQIKSTKLDELLGTLKLFHCHWDFGYLNQEKFPASIGCSVVVTPPAVFKLQIFFFFFSNKNDEKACYS